MMNRVSGQITRNTLKALEIEPEHNVLEIGFGGGLGIEALTNRLSTGVITGVDFSADMVNKAQSRFRTEIAQDRVVIRQGDISQLPFADRSFDRVFTVDTIYFWPDTCHGMAEIYRVLKAGGVAGIGLRSKGKMRTHAVTKYNFNLYDEDEVVELMKQARFLNIRAEHRDLEHSYDEVIVLGSR
jgi:ubiquinone/menaquinone biosynthesis C-methylase UbiE